MVWARLDDKFHGNEKALAVSLAATGLWTRCLSYAADKLTDGRVPASVIRLHGGARAAALTRELVGAGLFEDHGDGDLWIHDFLDYNPSRAEVEASKLTLAEKRAEAGRKGGLAKASKQARDGLANPGNEEVASALPVANVANGWQNPSPVTRNPYPEPDEKSALPASARKADELPPWDRETTPGVPRLTVVSGEAPYRPYWDAYCEGTGLTRQSPEYLAVEAESGRQLRTHVDPAVTDPADVRLAAEYLTRHVWPARGLSGRPTLGRVMSAIGEATSWEINGRPSVAAVRGATPEPKGTGRIDWAARAEAARAAERIKTT